MHVPVGILPAAARGHPACGAAGRLTGRLQVSKLLRSLLLCLTVPDLMAALCKKEGLVPCTRRIKRAQLCGMPYVVAARSDSQRTTAWTHW